MRKGQEPALLQRLAGDARIGIDEAGLQAALRADERFVGAALVQVDAFLAEVDVVLQGVPERARLSPRGDFVAERGRVA